MKKAILYGLALLCLKSTCLKAQQDPQFSQNMFNKLFNNPGYAGSNNSICATLLGRNQWVGIPGNPKTFQLSVHAPVPLLYGGTGLVVFQDQLGQEKTFGFKGSYAYRAGMGPGKIGVGVALGIINKSLGKDWRPLDPMDTEIPLAGASKTGFDMDLGVFYELQDKMYVGVSAMHIPATTLKDANFDYNLERHYYIMGGYIQDIPQMNIQLKPSVFVKTDGASTQLDINGIALWENKVWGGVSYRMQDAVSPMVGFQKDVGDGIFKLGYSYDITTSQLRNSSTGSHEIMLGYCLRMKPEPPVEHVRTVRFL